MGIFKRKPSISADGYERKIVNGYAHKGKVADMLAEGWEIENFTPASHKGTNFKMGNYLLKRKVV